MTRASQLLREPEPVSGVFPAQSGRTLRFDRLVERARNRFGVEVAAALDLTEDAAHLSFCGELLECTAEKEALLMLWMQECDSARVRPTPPKLLLVFGCLEVLLVPVQTPAARHGVLAVSLTRRVLRMVGELERMAAETALELEAEARRAECPTIPAASSAEIPTLPAPPSELFDQVA